MSTVTLVNTEDLRTAANEVEDYVLAMQSLGHPAINDKNIPRLIRRAALEIDILKAELWRSSQGLNRDRKS